MSRYSLHAPTKDELVLRLRKKHERTHKVLRAVEERLDAAMPQPMCRLCKAAPVQGPFDWTVCGPCFNKAPRREQS